MGRHLVRAALWRKAMTEKASLHLYAVFGLQDGSVRGGHFLSGSVRPTLEVTINETVKHMRRKKRPNLGIALPDIRAGG
jgi:predicted DNA-binding protein with PD1-like motif